MPYQCSLIDMGKKEIDVVLLDVGPAMHGYLEAASRAVSGRVLSKILNNPEHETLIVLFGTTDTKNPTHDEIRASDPDANDYEHISILQDLARPSLDTTLHRLRELPKGTGKPDFVDALTVVVDVLNRAHEARGPLDKVAKTLFLISNFAHAAKEVDDEFRQELIAGLKAQNVTLQVVAPPIVAPPPPGGASLSAAAAAAASNGMPSVDALSQLSTQMHCAQATPATADGTPDAQRHHARAAALDILQELLSETSDRDVRFVSGPAGLLNVFRTKDILMQCVKQRLQVGQQMVLRTRLYKKVAFEKLPPLKTRGTGPDGDLRNVAHSYEHFVIPDDRGDADDDEAGPSDPAAGPAAADMNPVDVSEIIKAYRYGKQFVPIDDTIEDEMKYHPGKQLQMLGFVACEPLRTDFRYLLLKDPQVLLPEQDQNSQVALSALVQAAHKRNRAAVVRYARTDSTAVGVYALLPQLGSATVPDHFVMVNLPFAEDLRDPTFPPLAARDDQLPSPDQNAVALKLVQEMDLSRCSRGVDEATGELLRPEDIVNPTLQRFYVALMRLVQGQPDVAGQEAQLPGPANQDPLVAATLVPPWAAMPPGARGAAAAFATAFPTHAVERVQPGGGGRRRFVDDPTQGAAAGVGASGAGPSSSSLPPVVLRPESVDEDFEFAVVAGRLSDAVAALCTHVSALVEHSVRGRGYANAARHVAAMRAACVRERDAGPFNAALRDLSARFRGDPSHSGFWDLVVADGVQLISNEEVPSSTVSPAEADKFAGAASADGGGPLHESAVSGSAADTTGVVLPGPSTAPTFNEGDLDDME